MFRCLRVTAYIIHLTSYISHQLSHRKHRKLFKLHDAVDAYGTFGHLVDKDVGRVQVLEGNAVGSVVELGPPAWPVPAFALASKPFRNIIYKNSISPKSFRGLNDLGPCEKI